MKHYIEFKRKLYDLIIDKEGNEVKAFDILKEVKPCHASKSCKEDSKYSNCDLWVNILNIAYRKAVGNHTEFLRMDKLPECVEVDSGGFLATIKVNVTNLIIL